MDNKGDGMLSDQWGLVAEDCFCLPSDEKSLRLVAGHSSTSDGKIPEIPLCRMQLRRCSSQVFATADGCLFL